MHTTKQKAVYAAVVAAFLAVPFSGCTNEAVAPTAAMRNGSVRAGAHPDLSAVVAQAGPAVVNISTTWQPASARGFGSGFIISPDGYILTTAQVVNGASEADVRLADRREFKARVVGKDARSEITLLKIDASGLPTVRVGDPSRVKAGEKVVAMGSPFGLQNSATAGIVSAKWRALPGGNFAPFIQTDVAVDPGNSGGPLLDMEGNVIGINSQVQSRAGGYMGAVFAIPIDIAMNIGNELQGSRKVRIGVSIQPVNQALAQSFGMNKRTGALVISVADDSPAARAGIRAGDIILAFNGKVIGDFSDLPLMVGELKPGEKANVRVWRNGAERDLMVTAGAMPGEQLASYVAGGTSR